MKIYMCAERKSRNPCARIEPGRVRFELQPGPNDCRARDLKFNCVWGQSCCQMWIQIDTAARAQKGNLPVGSSSSS